jgi:chromosome segregation protein
LEHIKTFQELYEELNKREFLRDHFIVFPHVGESGNSTMLRSGFASQYKDMPCVGGFVDGSVTQHGKGNIEILSGKNKAYGNRAIAVFQTSDNRKRDFSKLGAHPTWVKWALLTAEALAGLPLHGTRGYRLPSPGCRQSRLLGSRFQTASSSGRARSI